MSELADKIAKAVTTSRKELRSITTAQSGAVAAFKLMALREEYLGLVSAAFKSKLDKHLILDAREAARRSERELLLAIAKGRQDGSIETAFDSRERGNWMSTQTRRGRSTDDVRTHFPKFPVSSFLSASDLRGQYKNGVNLRIWSLAEPSDSEFEKIVSRARRAQALSLAGFLEMIYVASTSAPKKAAAPISSNRAVVTNALAHLHSVSDALSGVTELSTDIDSNRAAELLGNLRSHLSTLNRVQKLLKNRAEQ